MADLIALHSSDPASVYLSAWARTASAGSTAIDDALYEQRVIVRMLGMRRTMFVVPSSFAPVIQAACTDQIAARMRRQLAERLQRAGVAADAAGWLKDVGEAVLRVLAERGAATGAELADAEPRLREQIVISEGKSYGGPVSISSRVLMLLSAEGHIIRGRPRGGWTSGQFQWFAASAWPLQARAGPISADRARAELAGRWLRSFGPAPVSDLKWWTGWTLSQVKKALEPLRIAEVNLGGGTGIMLADDDETTAAIPAWPALLPALDPTAMGWQERAWYLGGDTAVLFDRSGNIGPTAWWDGQIVGGWAQRRSGEVVLRLLEDVGADAAAALSAEAERLEAWLGPARVTPRFRTPLERELSR